MFLSRSLTDPGTENLDLFSYFGGLDDEDDYTVIAFYTILVELDPDFKARLTLAYDEDDH
ncbi:hypothetical protein B0A50_07256 [Salinomyces thailandicus]|uniref:Uncharacterized protein n=1 Tax=Salinomyces thailandicus TaxID=706561 RepID=A0A4U0TN21_9PEZI|nr:hypothetical protein B0A50_07256 [Salinomyces thailandica]